MAECRQRIFNPQTIEGLGVDEKFNLFVGNLSPIMANDVILFSVGSLTVNEKNKSKKMSYVTLFMLDYICHPMLFSFPVLRWGEN